MDAEAERPVVRVGGGRSTATNYQGAAVIDSSASGGDRTDPIVALSSFEYSTSRPM